MNAEKSTHYRKVFDSPYLSSMDVVEPIDLTIERVTQESDKTKKSKDTFNTAYFAEKFIRQGEKLKPMILNATNSKMMAKLADSPFIEDWAGIRIRVYVEKGIKFGRDTVDGLRILPAPERKWITPDSRMWEAAKAAYVRDGNLAKVLAKADMSDEHIEQLKRECAPPEEDAA
ncbi:hypothetical protein RDV84_23250 [Lysobacter yananisis]|uniref:Uncharacterized protein n=1 Tax=Lysobacter yananisis TaxID=1003114 RepID=A0ABY9P920_9GAMM|nr:hypothetical protein [Lysobacter yananisis]WMT02844.1 hypothetical protein RDV84_23250 [Lysobacter yananisis]